MNNKKITLRRSGKRVLKAKRSRVISARYNFGSSPSFVSAVSRIYNQEIIDIDRFVKFADSFTTSSRVKN